MLRRLKTYGLSRRRGQVSDEVHQKVTRRIQEIINGPGSCGGYRTIWHTLQIEGYQVPRSTVQLLLKELDPEGVGSRQAHKLRRRLYTNPGPNYAWHIDGYDKLKPFGFPVHGCIDGFSRKVLWLRVTRSNNSPDLIAHMFLDTVKMVEGCPLELVTDLGTENGIAAAIQTFFHDNPDSHRYVPSPRNQRIESWWSYLNKNRSSWWRGFFSELESQGLIDLSDDLSKECLWYCFAQVIQEDLDKTVEHWNTHYIRRSRHGCVAGRPDSIFYLPENYGGSEHKLHVPDREIDYTRNNIIHVEVNNEYTEYFDYVRSARNMPVPTDWREAISNYEKLIEISHHGQEE